MSALPELHPYRRCFVSGNDIVAIRRLAEMVRSHGIDVASADELGEGQVITNELVRLISDSDFFAVMISDTTPAKTAYQLGLAQGLGKPCFVVFAGSPDLNLASAYLVAVEDYQHLEDAADELARFLRNAKRPVKKQPRIQRGQVEPFDWARNALNELRLRDRPDRYEQFETLCAKIFRAAGAEVAEVGRDQTIGADLVVWLNDIAYELGGPTLVECKLYSGGTGSVIKNSQEAARRIEAVMDRSNANLALLVYDHDRATPPPSLHETPRVLVFSIEDLISAMEHAELESEILKRRERALFRGRAQ